MSFRINELFSEIESVKAKSATEVRELEKELECCLQTAWDKDTEIAKAISALEMSNEYGSNEGGIYRWIRASFSQITERERPYFENYLQAAHCVSVDWENDALYGYEGESLVISEEGDVWLTDGVFGGSKPAISRRDYETEEERNALIEAWMEKNGYFPGVFRQTRHGDIFPVRTLSAKKGA